MIDYQLPASDADTFVNDVPLGNYFESIIGKETNAKAVANWVINNLRAKMSEMEMTVSDIRFPLKGIPDLVQLVGTGKISSKIAQDVFGEMFETGESPFQIVERKQLSQVSDSGEIERFCDEAIAANPKSAADFKSGKGAALNFLKGQVMKASKGKANPSVVGETLARKLKA